MRLLKKKFHFIYFLFLLCTRSCDDSFFNNIDNKLNTWPFKKCRRKKIVFIFDIFPTNFFYCAVWLFFSIKINVEEVFAVGEDWKVLENLFNKFSRLRVCWFERDFFVTRCLQQVMQDNKLFPSKKMLLCPIKILLNNKPLICLKPFNWEMNGTPSGKRLRVN